MRKSPIRHIVHQHKRTGKLVHNYTRGHGSQTLKISNPSFSLISPKNDLLFDLKKKFGTTEDSHESGHLLPDGSLLDSFANGRGQRFYDHRQAADALNTTTEQLKKLGVIRFIATSRTLNLEFNNSINKKQWNHVLKILKEDPMKEAIHFDVSNNDDKIITSQTVFTDNVLSRPEKPSGQYSQYLTMKQFQEKYVNA